jgi:segregation and condensation protein A
MGSTVPDKREFKAIVDGQELTQVPKDLFIPPDALEILLDSFSGPLDLLLYLIRKQNIDILNIPITSITKQYLQYIQLMESRRMELAADYLLMAAMLAEIKSRMLLPLTLSEEEDEDDPRMALVRRLQVYEQIKGAAELLDQLPRQERDYFPVYLISHECSVKKAHPDLALFELVEVMRSLLRSEQHRTNHHIEKEVLSVRDRMNQILAQLQQVKSLDFSDLYTLSEGRMGLVVSLLAILELARQSLLVITQRHVFAPIQVQAA